MRAAAVFVLAALFLAPPPAEAQGLLQRLGEAERVARMEQALAKDPTLRRYSIRVTAERAVVTVEGTVRSAAERQRVQALADEIGEIGSLVNRLQVEGGPPPTAEAAAPAPPPTAEPETAEPAAAEPEVTAPPSQAAPPRAPEPTPEASYYRVRRGDTLGKIARQHGTSVRTLQQLNNLRGTNIRVGQRLRVK